MSDRTSNGSRDRTHSLRRYLHIEAVFVFARRVDHVSAPLAGGPIGLPCFRAGAGSKDARANRSESQIMSNRLAARTRSETLASHILPISATMIGVCATLIGLVKLAEQKLGPSHVDEYAALAAVTFLASALASYLSIRYADRPRLSTRIE